MADFKKFVFVKAGKSDEELAALLKSDGDIMSSTGKYYQSIVFVQQTNTIYNRGTQFGFSAEDAAKIKTLEEFKTKLEGASTVDGSLAKLLADAKSYTDEKAKAAKTEIAEGTGIKVTADTTATDGHTKYTIANDLDLVYVAATTGENAATAKINLIDKSDSTVIGSVEVSDVIGNGILKSTSYSKDTGILSLTFNEADGSDDKVVEVNLAEMLDINDMSIATDSTNYLTVNLEGDENSQAVFGAKIVKLADASSSSTGLADAYNVKGYADAILGTSSDDADANTVYGAKAAAAAAQDDATSALTKIGVEKGGDVTESTGLYKKIEEIQAGSISIAEASKDNTDAGVKVQVTTKDGSVTGVAVAVTGGSVANGDTSVVTGGAVFTAIKEKVEGLDTTDDVTTASVTDGVVTLAAGVKEVDGIIAKGTGTDITLAKVATTGSSDDVTAPAVTAGTDSVAVAAGSVTSQIASLAKSIKSIDNHTKTTVVTGSANGTVAVDGTDVAVKGLGSAAYTASTAYDAAGKAQELIDALAGDATSDDAAVATVEVKTTKGQVSDVIVTTTSASVNRTNDAEDARVLAASTSTGAVTGADIALIKGYVDDKISDNVDWAEL